MAQKTVSLSEGLFNDLADYAEGKGLLYGGKPSVRQAVESLYNMHKLSKEYTGIEYIRDDFAVSKKNGAWVAIDMDTQRQVYSHAVKHNVIAWCMGVITAKEAREKYG